MHTINARLRTSAHRGSSRLHSYARSGRAALLQFFGSGASRMSRDEITSCMIAIATNAGRLHTIWQRNIDVLGDMPCKQPTQQKEGAHQAHTYWRELFRNACPLKLSPEPTKYVHYYVWIDYRDMAKFVRIRCGQFRLGVLASHRVLIDWTMISTHRI